jgi:hypothetical protein
LGINPATAVAQDVAPVFPKTNIARPAHIRNVGALTPRVELSANESFKVLSEHFFASLRHVKGKRRRYPHASRSKRSASSSLLKGGPRIRRRNQRRSAQLPCALRQKQTSITAAVTSAKCHELGEYRVLFDVSARE